MAYTRGKYLRIVATIYLTLPYTLVKQRLFFRLRKAPAGLPDFLCIGAQKSGTTWLNEQLKKHPGICMPAIKETRYFDWYFYRSFKWYRSHFRCESGKIIGDVTPGYSIIEKGRIRFIRRTMPHAKIILLLRDPRERAWSSARYHFGNQLGRDLKSVSTEEFLAHFQKAWVKRMGDYETIWKKWSSVFPREQLLVIFNEEISRNPEEVMNRICSFIGVEKQFDKSSLTIQPNKSEEMVIPAELKKYLDHVYIPVIKRLPEWLGMENKFWKV